MIYPSPLVPDDTIVVPWLSLYHLLRIAGVILHDLWGVVVLTELSDVTV